MILVVDASVATKWFLPETGHHLARELAAGENILIAPELIVAEVCNTFWKKVMRGEASADQAKEVAIGLPKVFRELASCAVLAPRALEMALELRHPAYDCFYLALAEFANTALVTADAGLVRAARRGGIPPGRIQLLGDAR